MTVHDVEQRTEQWMALRCGRVTSTGASKMLTKGRGNQHSVQRRDYALQIVTERLTGKPQEHDFQSSWMQRGTEMEPEAIAAYEASTGALVEPVGFCTHDEIAAGASPDGFVGVDGVVELKVPKAATHLRYLQLDQLPSDYLAQATHLLWITGRPWLDFVSYGPMFPEPLQIFRFRLEAKTLDLAAYGIAVRLFLREVDAQEQEVRALIERKAVA